MSLMWPRYMTLIYESCVGMKLWGELQPNAIFNRVVKVGGIRMEERGLQMKGDQRWIITMF